MAKSSLAIGLMLLSVAGGEAAAQPVSAEAALQAYRERFRPVAELRCPRDPGAELVVCGRRGVADPNRLPLPVEPVPGARTAGEPPSQLAASEVGSEPCTNVGLRAGACSGFIPILPIALWIVHAAVKAVEASKDGD